MTELSAFEERTLRRGVAAVARTMRERDKRVVTARFTWRRGLLGLFRPTTGEELTMIAGIGPRALQVAQLADEPLGFDPTVQPSPNESRDQVPRADARAVDNAMRCALKVMRRDDTQSFVIRAPDFEDPAAVVFARGDAAVKLRERARLAGLVN